MTRALALLETSGNQAYLFATNKMREVVGGSELLYRCGTSLPLQQVDAWRQAHGGTATGLRGNDDQPFDPAVLSDAEANPPLDPADDKAVEVVLATSGKAILLCGSAETARAIVAGATRAALARAPGVDLRGAVVPAPDPGGAAADMDAAFQSLYRTMEADRGRLPAPEQRFPGLPQVARCRTTGLPAARTIRNEDIEPSDGGGAAFGRGTDPGPRAEIAVRKEKSRVAAYTRLDNWMDPGARPIDDWVDDEWLGVIHADGNGVGQIFMGFRQAVENIAGCHAVGRDYLHWQRRFSAALDGCSRRAMAAALDTLKRQGHLHDRDKWPVLPLVMGGDDLTVLCQGRIALPLTIAYLRTFEAETEADTDVSSLATAAHGAARLSACAGVALVKPHFPFHTAYDMAEDLLRQAKQVKRHAILTAPSAGGVAFAPCSAFDVHLNYGASGGDIHAVRDHWRDRGTDAAGNGPRLTGRPYVVTPMDWLDRQSLCAEARDWCAAHHVGHLSSACAALHRVDDAHDGNLRDDDARDDDTALPRRYVHRLRTALFEGPELAEQVVRNLGHRYGKALQPLTEDTAGRRSLFFTDRERTADGNWSTVRRTRLLDAVDLAQFLPAGADSPDQDGDSEAGPCASS